MTKNTAQKLSDAFLLWIEGMEKFILAVDAHKEVLSLESQWLLTEKDRQDLYEPMAAFNIKLKDMIESMKTLSARESLLWATK